MELGSFRACEVLPASPPLAGAAQVAPWLPARARAQRVLPGAVVPLLALLLAGCSTEGTMGGPSPVATSVVDALISVRRSATLPPEGPVRTLTEVRFVRSDQAHSSELVMRLLTQASSLPPAGSCAPATQSQDPSLLTLAPLELVQAGDVSLESSGSPPMLLATRAYPDVARVLSGVVYTSPDGSPALATLKGALTLHVTGSQDVPPLDASFELPSSIDTLTLDGAPIAQAHVLQPGDAPWLGWHLEPSDDRILVEVQPAFGLTWQCVPELGESSLRLPAAAVVSGASVVVHRLHNVVLAPTGLRSGTVNMDLALTAPLRVKGVPAETME